MVCVNFGLNEDYEKLTFTTRLLHNTRKHKTTKNSIFSKSENLNYVNDEIKKIKNRETLDKYFAEEEENYKLLIKEKTKQKSKMKNHLLETIISFSSSDYDKYSAKKLNEIVMNYTKQLEKEFKIKVYAVSGHYDEGHLNEKNEEIRNVHFHIIHSNVNHETGKSFTRQIFINGNKDYSFIQKHFKDFIVKNLDENYDISIKKDKTKKTKNLDYRTYKRLAQEKEQLKAKITNQYKNKIKEFKEQAKTEIKEIKEQALIDLRKQRKIILQQQDIIEKKDKEITELKKEILELQKKLEKTTTQSQKHQLERKINNLMNIQKRNTQTIEM
jgi:hypothetical protein